MSVGNTNHSASFKNMPNQNVLNQYCNPSPNSGIPIAPQRPPNQNIPMHNPTPANFMSPDLNNHNSNNQQNYDSFYSPAFHFHGNNPPPPQQQPNQNYYNYQAQNMHHQYQQNHQQNQQQPNQNDYYDYDYNNSYVVYDNHNQNINRQMQYGNGYYNVNKMEINSCINYNPSYQSPAYDVNEITSYSGCKYQPNNQKNIKFSSQRNEANRRIRPMAKAGDDSLTQYLGPEYQAKTTTDFTETHHTTPIHQSRPLFQPGHGQPSKKDNKMSPKMEKYKIIKIENFSQYFKHEMVFNLFSQFGFIMAIKVVEQSIT